MNDSTEPITPPDEIITISMPVWAFQGIMNGLEKWMGKHWDDEAEITAPITFNVVPPSWQIEEHDGMRYLMRAADRSE
jgi:hypothetical protein